MSTGNARETIYVDHNANSICRSRARPCFIRGLQVTGQSRSYECVNIRYSRYVPRDNFEISDSVLDGCNHGFYVSFDLFPLYKY